MGRRTEIIRPEVFRQSLVAGFVTCPRRTRFALHAGDNVSTGWVGTTGDLGSAVHEVAAAILRTIVAQKSEKLDGTEQAIAIMYETMRASAIVLNADDLDTLRWLTLELYKIRWVNAHERVLTIEEDLTAQIVCEDGEVRTLKGTPDVVMLDGTGLKIPDWKSGRSKPSAPRGKYPEPGVPVEGYEYLSERGRMQGEIYGLLALERYKPATHATFAEYHLRSGQIRTITITREQMEHVRRRAALWLEQLDLAIEEGARSPRWFARSGSHCTRQCPVARSCPIPPEQRGDGVLDSQPKVDAAAKGLAKLDGQRKALVSQLKAAYEEHGWVGEVNEHEVLGWQETANGRKWAIHPKPEPVEETADVAGVFNQTNGAE